MVTLLSRGKFNGDPMTMRRTMLLGCVVALGSTGFGQGANIVHYPKPDGVVFALPHVSVILKALTPSQRKRLRLVVDDRAVPNDAVAGCRICAGDKPAVIAAKARWTVTDGVHRLQASFGDSAVAFRYTLDSSVPSLSGLSGTIALPDAHAAVAQSVRVGVSRFSRSPRHRVWLSLTGGRWLPVELAIERTLNRDGAFAWKVAFIRSQRWGVSVGQRDGDAFIALGYRSQPNDWNVTVGGGEGTLPPVWVGVSYSLSHLTRRWRFSERWRDVIAVLDLVRVQAEVDNRGRLNLGAWLCHPYGWRIGVHRVSAGIGGSGWVGQVSFSRAWR